MRAPGWNRTSGPQVRNLVLSPLSYEGKACERSNSNPLMTCTPDYSRFGLSNVGALAWGDRGESNPRLPGPQPGAHLRYTTRDRRCNRSPLSPLRYTRETPRES
jgi:hypothetical protein